ncbi:sigma-70 family RNA polymerase sigma factor [Pedobacter frigidisoli]|uniref:Sigma-70 family RNA polymerase sigma factor n=1 Tax=Pedobacter frigidisoli TaxID=2530455 RepID=A0A4R0NX75_9SPHI|nr:sigma-70 family RNA polymerase sigma factor [Pedobacter frigidisoli]TCD04235.1 sigma-70 family RNA polymerase sigma factor [Pedobacter frigidisoli]
MYKELESNFFLLVKSNKEKAFQLVFDAYWETLYKQALKKIHSNDLAQDLVQEVFICLWDKIDLLDAEKSVLAYLYAILRNKVLKVYEKDEVSLRYAINVTAKESTAHIHSQNILLEKELKRIIDLEIERIPPRMKEIYILKKEDDLSIKEIADNLSLSEQTIKNQLQSAYTRLRMRVKDYDSSLALLAIFIAKHL